MIRRRPAPSLSTRDFPGTRWLAAAPGVVYCSATKPPETNTTSVRGSRTPRGGGHGVGAYIVLRVIFYLSQVGRYLQNLYKGVNASLTEGRSYLWRC